MASSFPRSDMLFDGPARAKLTVALAHGAGAGMDHPFMARIAVGLGKAGFRVARFEFPYMAARRKDGKKRPPDRAPVLQACIDAVVRELGPERLVLAGKSMGGRIAADRADALGVRGLICLGFPFHAPGKPVGTRAEALAKMRAPTLILQGERDPFGTAAEVAGYRLAKPVRVHILADGDHSLKPRKAAGWTEAQNLDEAVAEAALFLDTLAA